MKRKKCVNFRMTNSHAVVCQVFLLFEVHGSKEIIPCESSRGPRHSEGASREEVASNGLLQQPPPRAAGEGRAESAENSSQLRGMRLVRLHKELFLAIAQSRLGQLEKGIAQQLLAAVGVRGGLT